METKQTAVEWLYDRFLFAGYAVNSEWKEKAKEMHKQEIVEAYRFGLSDEYVIGSEKYYNQHFRK